MTKISDSIASRTKAAGLDRLKAKLESIVQPCELRFGHLFIAIREDEINLSFRQSRRCIARNAAVLDVDTDRFHRSKNTPPRAPRKCRWCMPLVLAGVTSAA